MTHLYVWRDSPTQFTTGLMLHTSCLHFHIRDMTPVTWLTDSIYYWSRAPHVGPPLSYAWHDSFVGVTWLTDSIYYWSRAPRIGVPPQRARGNPSALHRNEVRESTHEQNMSHEQCKWVTDGLYESHITVPLYTQMQKRPAHLSWVTNDVYGTSHEPCIWVTNGLYASHMTVPLFTQMQK